MPQLTAPAVQDAYAFNALGPRIGATYAIDESRKTVVRASYAMTLSPSTAGNDAPPNDVSVGATSIDRT